MQLSAPGQVVSGAPFKVGADASDPDGSIAKVVFSDGSVQVVDTSAPYEATFTAPSSGPVSVQATAYDNRGASASDSASVATGPNQALTWWSDNSGDPNVDVGIIGLDGLTSIETQWLKDVNAEMDQPGGMTALIAQTYFTNDKRGVGTDVSTNELRRFEWYYDGPPIPFVLQRLQEFRAKVVDSANLAAVDDRINYWTNVLAGDPAATLWEGQNSINDTRVSQGKSKIFPAWSRIGIHVEPFVLYPDLRVSETNTAIGTSILNWTRGQTPGVGWLQEAGICNCENVDTKYASGFGYSPLVRTGHILAVYPWMFESTVTLLDDAPFSGYPQTDLLYGLWDKGNLQGLPWGELFWAAEGHLAFESAQPNHGFYGPGDTLKPLMIAGFANRSMPFIEVDTAAFSDRPATPVDNITGFPGVPSLDGNVSLYQVDIHYPYLNAGDDSTLYVGSIEPALHLIQSVSPGGLETEIDYNAFKSVCTTDASANLILVPQ